MNLVLRVVRPEDVCLDIGANIGVYSLLFARRATRGLVIAVEPTPETFRRLEESIERNNLTGRTSLVNKAIGDRSGFLDLEIGDYSALNRAARSSTPSHTKTINVPCTTLDEIARELGLSRCDFIKIDVEGFEERVIMGARASLERFRPKVIQFEANGLSLDYGCDLRSLFATLGAMGYRFGVYDHAGSTIHLVRGFPPSVSPTRNYLALSSEFISGIRELVTVIEVDELPVGSPTRRRKGLT